MDYAPVQLISNGDMSQATLTSTGVFLDQLINLSLVATATGSPVGSLAIQVSNDNVPLSQGTDPAGNVKNWAALSSPTAIGAAGSYAVNLADQGYLWLRCLYTKTSGTGLLTVNFNGKQ